MKNSKTFLVLTVALFLVFAVSACTAAPSQNSGEITYKNHTVSATITAREGDNLTLSVTPSLSYVAGGSGMSLATVTNNGAIQIQGTNVQYTFVFTDSDIAFDDENSIQYVFSGTQTKTVTAAPEMLKGFAVGDKVRVTFDENENVSKIEKREETPETDEKEDKENSKDNYDIVTEK